MNVMPTSSQASFDRWLLLATVGLLAIGLIMVTSASMVISERHYHHPFHYLFRQAIYVGMGLILGIFVGRISLAKWQAHSIHLFFLSILLLIIVLIPGIGRTVNGSTRWLWLGVANFQVSELVKLCVIAYLAGYLVRHRTTVQADFASFMRPLLLLGIIAGLLLKEPDFGAVMVILLTALGMFFAAGVPLRQFFVVMLVVGSAAVLMAISSPYRVQRLVTFLDPWAHPFESGYQLTQALIAFGRGGWWGVGLGESVQKLFYLPEAHTDFIFAVLVEELGLIGALGVISLFILLVLRSFAIAKRALQQGQLFSGYFAYGLGMWLGLQALINMGVSCGILPTKGLTLPLMSSGGSSMLMNGVVLAILFRIDYENRRLA